MKTLNQNQKAALEGIVYEAMNLVKENAEGLEFVRINLYEDAKNEIIEKGETELEICGVHFFSNSQWDDIKKENQIEIANFEQDEMNWVEGDGTWKDTQRGEDWLKLMEETITETVTEIITK
jgi:hypothetical protein